MPNISWLWLLVGIALGVIVVPRVLSKVSGN